MDKRIIGIFRVAVYFVLICWLKFPVAPFETKLWISDLVHGSHGEVLRNTTSVQFLMFLYFGVMSFYITQTLFYILIGGALNGRDTSIIKFFSLLIQAIRELGNTPNFWTSSSGTSSNSNIARLLDYRDNKMALMSNSDAVEFMKGTGHVDMMLSRPDLKQSRRTMNYLNNKISLMDNESALKFIRGEK